MKKRIHSKKMKSIISITILSALAIYLLNKLIFGLAIMKNMLHSRSGNYYKWRFGKIHYNKQGSGPPLLLIHDLTIFSSAYEWNKVTKQLSESYTVYTIDLLGCGRSDKPMITYTNYLYIQLITDFIKNVIGQETNVVATNASGSFVIMACHNDSSLFNRIMIINPEDINKGATGPTKKTKYFKLILETPLIGTMIYNFFTSKKILKIIFYKEYFYDKKKCSRKNIQVYHESAHLGKTNAKFLFSSIKSNFININITRALKQINHKIIILGSAEIRNMENIITSYSILNSSVQKRMISNVKHLPQLEDPLYIVDLMKIYFE